MDSIQRLRVSAQNLGNLQSTPQQQVVDDGGCIELLPAEPDVIYVPVYQPDAIYFQSGLGLTFGTGIAIGAWLNCDFDWHHHNLIVWGHDHPRPADWWHERPDRRDADLGHQTTVWHPTGRSYPVVVNRGDRGWNNPDGRPAVPVAGRPETRPTPPHTVTTIGAPANAPRPAATPRPAAPPGSAPVTVVNRPAPAPIQHFAPASRPVSNSALTGIQSPRDTRADSNRGRQSLQTVDHSAPARPAPTSRPAPAAGGGGNHATGSQPRR